MAKQLMIKPGKFTCAIRQEERAERFGIPKKGEKRNNRVIFPVK